LYVGNSSSGILEAASFHLPVVNVGNRQEGRLRPENVVDVPFDRKKIRWAINKACSSIFRESLKKCENPFGDGKAGKRISETLIKVSLTQQFICKQFVNKSKSNQKIK